MKPWAKEAMMLAVVGLSLGETGACTAASAIGCTTGVVSGIALGGIAAAEASDDPQSEVEVDSGAAILGGAFFGAVSGCTAAAVTDAIARSGAKHESSTRARERAPREWHAPTPHRANPSEVDPGEVTANAHFHGISVSWRGQPQLDAERVELRFQRYVKRDQQANCDQVELELDGKRQNLPARHSEVAGGSVVLETIQARVAVELLRRMQEAKRVVLRLCEGEHLLTLPTLEANQRFLTRFARLVPQAWSASSDREAQPEEHETRAEPESESEVKADSSTGATAEREPASSTDATASEPRVLQPSETPTPGPTTPGH